MTPDQAAGETLSRAFFTDEVFRWAVPSDDGRRAMGRWFSAMVRWGRRYGEVQSLGPAERPTAVAVWGAKPADFVQHVRAGLWWPTLALGLPALWRLLRLGDRLQASHDRLCPEPHRYLYFLGVDPAHQRKGLGSELVRPTLVAAHQQGLPCYLETGTEENVRFYQRLGFGVAYQGEVLPGAPSFWLLKTAPQAK